MGKKIHYLSDIDMSTRTAQCAHCGHVRVHTKKGMAICSVRNSAKAAAWRNAPENRERVRTYNRAYINKGDNRIGYRWSSTNATARKFGYAGIAMSRNAFIEWYKSQPRQCVWCGGSKRLSVDHDHITGQLRGLKCLSCNVVEGFITRGGGQSYIEAVYLGYTKQSNDSALAVRP